MKLDLDRFDRSLGKGEHWVLQDGRGWTLECRSGCVWITQDRDLRDVVLKPGMQFTLDRDGPACITAFEISRLFAVATPEAVLAPARNPLPLLARLRNLFAPLHARNAAG